MNSLFDKHTPTELIERFKTALYNQKRNIKRDWSHIPFNWNKAIISMTHQIPLFNCFSVNYPECYDDFDCIATTDRIQATYQVAKSIQVHGMYFMDLEVYSERMRLFS